MALSQKQIDIIREPYHDINILSGVTGSGKSWIVNILIYELLCTLDAGDTIILTGNTSESLYDNVISPIFECDKGIDMIQWVTVQNNKRIISKRGVQAVCVGANNERAQSKIQGKPQVKYWFGDEVTTHPRSFVEMALSRLRYRDKENNIQFGKAVWTCNPDAPTHYIKKNYIDSKDMDVKNWYFGFYDNPIMTDSYVDQIAKRFTGVFHDRMILGKWVAAEGTIYSMFDRSKHIIDKLPDDVSMSEFVLGVDWGYNHKLAILLFAVDYDGVYYLVDEIAVKGQLIDDSLKDLMKTKGWFDIKHKNSTYNINYAYCDSARPEYLQIFRNLTGITTLPAFKEVHEGIQMIQHFLTPDKRDKPRLLVCKDCTETLSEMDAYHWQMTRTQEKDEPDKINDDCMDALRYTIFTRERGRVRVINKSFFKKT